MNLCMSGTLVWHKSTFIWCGKAVEPVNGVPGLYIDLHEVLVQSLNCLFNLYSDTLKAGSTRRLILLF